MKPWELLGETRTPDGTLMALTRRGGEYVIHADGKSLMSSRMHGSEEALATLGCRGLAGRPEPRVLIGGLGMGFTLRAALALLPPGASVVVAELVPAVAEWNRGPLGPLAGHPLRDPRVRLELCDVAAVLRASPGAFDAVLLDVDNGPSPLTASDNAGLYDDRGIAAARAALRPGGTLAVWSAREDRAFEHRLRYAGFSVETEGVRGRLARGGPRHTIFLARLEARR
jgi:spermidine synthase